MADKNIKIPVVLALLCFAIWSIFVPEAVFSAADTGFYLTQDTGAARTGGQFVVYLNGENLEDMYAYEAKFSFDTDKLELAGSTSFLQGAAVNPKTEGGNVFIAFTKIGPKEGEYGNKTLRSITFGCKARGDAAVRLEWVKVVDSKLNSQTYMVGKSVSVSISESTQKGAADKKETSTGQKKVTTYISQDEMDRLYGGAVPDESGVKRIEIEIQGQEGANEYETVFPPGILTSDGHTGDIVLKTPLGTLVIPNNMFKPGDVEGQSDISISLKLLDSGELSESLRQAAGGRPVIQLSVRVGGKLVSWNNPDAPVKVLMPYSPTEQEAAAPDCIVVLCVDDPQNPVVVSSGFYNPETQTVTFTLHHFSLYTIGFIEKTFGDLAGYAWAKPQIEALAARGIIKGVSQTSFAPSAHITRADFLCLLIRACGLTATVDSNFEDVKETDYFYEPVGIAKKYGIATGIDNRNFRPGDKITRQDMMVLAERAMRLMGKLKAEGSASDLAMFKDADRISPYALSKVAAMVKEGIIQGSNNMINPLDNTTRAEAAVVIYRLYKRIFN